MVDAIVNICIFSVKTSLHGNKEDVGSINDEIIHVPNNHFNLEEIIFLLF